MDLEHQALLDLTLGLRRWDLSAFMREVARRAREVLGVEFCEVLEFLADGDRAVLEPRTEHAGPPLRAFVSGVSALICANGCIFGVLGAYSTSKRCYTEEEVGFLQNAAELLGVAVERAVSEKSYRRSLEKEKRRAEAAEERYALLHEANAVLNTAPHGPAALAAVTRLAIPAFADRCFVELLDEDAAPRGRIRRLVVAHSGEHPARELTHRYPLDPSAPHGTPKVLRTGRAELIPEVRDELLRGIARDDEYESAPGLTPRQLEVLRLLDMGMRVHQIKAELNLSEPTVRTHVRAILRAFGAGSQLEALHRARALGLLEGVGASCGHRY